MHVAETQVGVSKKRFAYFLNFSDFFEFLNIFEFLPYFVEF